MPLLSQAMSEKKEGVAWETLRLSRGPSFVHGSSSNNNSKDGCEKKPATATVCTNPIWESRGILIEI